LILLKLLYLTNIPWLRL